MRNLKKKTLLTATTFFLASCTLFLSSCGEPSRNKISFGTYIENTYTNLESFEKVIEKINVTHESFVLTVYPSNGCSCWSDFQPLLNRFTREKHVLNYSISNVEIKQAENKYGFSYSESSPILYFVNEKAEKTKIDYYDGSTSPFVNYNSFVNLFEKYCDYPQIFLVDDDYLTSNLPNKDKQVVHFYRESCSDCKDSFPHVIFPFARNRVLDNEIWAFDLDPLKPTEDYQPMKDKWFLSNAVDTTYGYDSGVVPTTQYYENGILKDMNVYFNDSVIKINDEFVISNSYYTDERKPHLHYLDSEDEMLLNKVLPSEQINIRIISINPSTQIESYSWKKEFAREYHAKYLNSFLIKYAL